MQGKLLKAKVLGVFLVVAAAVSVVVAAVSTPLQKQAAPSYPCRTLLAPLLTLKWINNNYDNRPQAFVSVAALASAEGV